MSTAQAFLSGGTMMGALVSGLFFFRYWRRTRERLLGAFGIAFWIMALERLVMLFNGPTDFLEARTSVYVLRLVAYLLILIAIWDKNRARTS